MGEIFTEKLPPAVREALERLTAAGYEAHVVGGCVRDLLHSETPGDYDITTSALPPEIEAVFAGERTVETGIKHGTVTVLLHGMPLEITTYRLESTYSDHRHPDAVSFTRSLREDLARRDFTVNAMAMAPDGHVTDLFGGREDLANKILRCVGEPEQRFREDALRILRALRFASVLDFTLEEETLSAAKRLASLLCYVSAERLREELAKLLCGKAAARVLAEGVEILQEILPECFSAPKGITEGMPEGLSPETLRLFSILPPVFPLRFAALLQKTPLMPDLSMGNPPKNAVNEDEIPQTATSVLVRFKVNNKTKNLILQLVGNRRFHLQSDADLLTMCGKLSPETTELLLTLQSGNAEALGEAPGEFEKGKHRLRALLAAGRCYRIRDLAIGGEDLLRLGVQKGPDVGKLLQTLLESVISEKCENTREALTAAAAVLLEGQK